MKSLEAIKSSTCSVNCISIIPKICWLAFSAVADYKDRTLVGEISFVIRYGYNFKRKVWKTKIFLIDTL